jgi:hypothetical protein
MNSGAPGYVDEVSEQFYAQLQWLDGAYKSRGNFRGCHAHLIGSDEQCVIIVHI